MRLLHVTYLENTGEPASWGFTNLDLESVSLVVGMNASGKTRTLNVISGLASLLSGRRQQLFRSGSYRVRFMNDDPKKGIYEYFLETRDSEVVREKLVVGGSAVLARRKSGMGTIQAKQLGETIKFRVPKGQLAVVAKRDSLQHRFLESLCQWGSSVRHFRCGTSMGKEAFVAVGKGATVKGKFAPDAAKPISTFLSGLKRFGRSRFERPIVRDMRAIGYRLRHIAVGPPTSMTIESSVGEVVGLRVQESGLDCETDQHAMSEGMFRALALLIQLNYAILDAPTCCILIDDIGEGLDYERSVALIKVVREKALGSPMQLIMTTNDRFVMNQVPLTEWQVLERDRHRVKFFNHRNARAAFEEFSFTGLSNFDFFRSGVFSKGRNGDE